MRGILLCASSPRARFFRLRDAASASRSFRSSRTTAASAVGLTCVARVFVARARLVQGRGTHALVAEAREHLERRAAEVRVQQVAHFLHGCVGDER